MLVRILAGKKIILETRTGARTRQGPVVIVAAALHQEDQPKDDKAKTGNGGHRAVWVWFHFHLHPAAV